MEVSHATAVELIKSSHQWAIFFSFHTRAFLQQQQSYKLAPKRKALWAHVPLRKDEQEGEGEEKKITNKR